jgi:hypothetical protein
LAAQVTLIVVEDAARPRQSPRIAIRRLLGASRLTTSGCSRLRAQASELAHVLTTDPRRLGTKSNLDNSVIANPRRMLSAMKYSLSDELNIK